MVNGKFDPTAGLVSSGIAGTAPDKEDEENKNTDEEMKDVSKKDGGKYCVQLRQLIALLMTSLNLMFDIFLKYICKVCMLFSIYSIFELCIFEFYYIL